VDGRGALDEVGEWAVGITFSREARFIFHDHVAVDGAFVEAILKHGADEDVLETAMKGI
jgi:hypothetical protein